MHNERAWVVLDRKFLVRHGVNVCRYGVNVNVNRVLPSAVSVLQMTSECFSIPDTDSHPLQLPANAQRTVPQRSLALRGMVTSIMAALGRWQDEQQALQGGVFETKRAAGDPLSPIVQQTWHAPFEVRNASGLGPRLLIKPSFGRPSMIKRR